jgi:acyl dehydratase
MSVDPATVREGDEIPPLELTPDIEHVRRYFTSSRNSPHFFFDEEAAKAQGLPGRLVPGPLKVGFLYGAIENWLGEAGYVRSVRAAHRRPDVQGRPIVVTGNVARVYEEGGARRADLEMFIINAEGQPSVRGFATVEFWP